MHPFERLSRPVQRWVANQGWPDLRPIQQKAIDAVLPGTHDVLISASTAGGKTEAAFLPACSLATSHADGYSVLYVSPLKALINDQYRRLKPLCDMAGILITPWHGDAAQSAKSQSRANPNGVLLITPESLEAMLIRHPRHCRAAFHGLQNIIIDEFHAFIGTERGQQLLSLLTRLEHVTGRIERPIPRIALSATLGDLEGAPIALRPNNSLPCITVTDPDAKGRLSTKIKGFRNPPESDDENSPASAESRICGELYRLCRGGSHLVFANSRQRCESLSAKLSDLCQKDTVPNEFFPHHGSLSKDVRHQLETELQKGKLPRTAVCTMTLELGIDIGTVDSTYQVTPPHQVSSLRQRLGRCGRRGGPSVLRFLIAEEALNDDSHLVDSLRLQVIQTLAMVKLLAVDKWCEPPKPPGLHFSTLVHQIMSVTAQWGAVRADRLYHLLCRHGPFSSVAPSQFKTLLSQLGQQDCLTQLSSGELTLGLAGERLVNRHTFYAVFQTPEEYRVLCGDRPIGTLPMDSPVVPGQKIVFAGTSWLVLSVDTYRQTISVAAASHGKPPQFGGRGGAVHDAVRQEMKRIYATGEAQIETGGGMVSVLDDEALSLFDEGIRTFRSLKLSERGIVEHGGCTYLIPWKGDKVVDTITALLLQCGCEVASYAGVIEVAGTTPKDLRKLLLGALRRGFPTAEELAAIVPEKVCEKFDELLSPDLLNLDYGQRSFNVPGAQEWIESNLVE